MRANVLLAVAQCPGGVMEGEDAILHAVATWQAQAPLAFADRENPLLTEHPGMTEIIACVKRMDRYPGDSPIKP